MKWLNYYYNQLLELNFKTWVVSILVIWLPISNLVVQYIVNVLRGTTLVANIKDVLILGLMINLAIDIVRLIKQCLTKKNKTSSQKIVSLLLPCLPLILVIILNILAFVSSFVFNQVGIKIFVIGYYFELFWLGLLALWLTWSNLKSILHIPKEDEEVLESISNIVPQKSSSILNFNWSVIIRAIVIGFVLVAVVSLVSIGLGQSKTLQYFGYGQTSIGGLVSSNNPCHTIDYGIDTCRLMGSFGHPLHFVSYLLLVLGIFISQLVISPRLLSRLFYGGLVIFNLVFIYLSHTRFAIFGLILTLGWLIFGLGGSFLNREYLFFGRVIKLWLGKVAMMTIVAVILIITVFVVNVDINTQFPEIAARLPVSLTKPSSSAWHIRQTQSNLQVIRDSPDKLFTGYGLGIAGSTARAKYQNIETNPIYQKLLQQGKFYPDMIQDYIMIPDNWLIQTTLNGGLIYTLVYLILLLYPLRYLYDLFRESSWDMRSITFGLLACSLGAILVGSLIQQLFESQVTVFFFVMVCGMVSKKRQQKTSL